MKKGFKETHWQGTISIENIPDGELCQEVAEEGFINTYYLKTGSMSGNLGIKITEDGRVWVCINGIAFLRFSPHTDGKMSKE